MSLSGAQCFFAPRMASCKSKLSFKTSMCLSRVADDGWEMVSLLFLATYHLNFLLKFSTLLVLAYVTARALALSTLEKASPTSVTSMGMFLLDLQGDGQPRSAVLN